MNKKNKKQNNFLGLSKKETKRVIKKAAQMSNQLQKELVDKYDKNKNKKTEMPIVFNIFGEGRCPGCDIELYWRAVHEIINKKQKLQCQCGMIITPQK